MREDALQEYRHQLTLWASLGGNGRPPALPTILREVIR